MQKFAPYLKTSTQWMCFYNDAEKGPFKGRVLYNWLMNKSMNGDFLVRTTNESVYRKVSDWTDLLKTPPFILDVFSFENPFFVANQNGSPEVNEEIGNQNGSLEVNEEPRRLPDDVLQKDLANFLLYKAIGVTTTPIADELLLKDFQRKAPMALKRLRDMLIKVKQDIPHMETDIYHKAQVMFMTSQTVDEALEAQLRTHGVLELNDERQITYFKTPENEVAINGEHNPMWRTQQTPQNDHVDIIDLTMETDAPADDDIIVERVVMATNAGEKYAKMEDILDDDEDDDQP